jgi:predicted RNase H-like HicB family nuclease
MKKNIYDFKVIIEQDESGGFFVSCPSLQGCYSQGDTIDEALENIKEAILLCMEDLESTGEEIPNPSKILIGNVLISK